MRGRGSIFTAGPGLAGRMAWERRGFAGLWMAVLDWHDLWRSRRALLRLSDAHLRDIGLTRESALEEVRLSFLADD